jgi:hypothetical protein
VKQSRRDGGVHPAAHRNQHALVLRHRNAPLNKYAVGYST